MTDPGAPWPIRTRDDEALLDALRAAAAGSGDPARHAVRVTEPVRPPRLSEDADRPADLLAALALLANRYGGDRPLLLGLDERASVHIDPDPALTVGAYLARVRAQLAAAEPAASPDRSRHIPAFGLITRKPRAPIGHPDEISTDASDERPRYAVAVDVDTDGACYRLRSAEIPGRILRQLAAGLSRLHGELTDPARQLAELGSLALLGDDECRQVAETGRGEHAAAAADRVDTAFEKQARLTPGAVALTFLGAHITYQQLAARAELIGRGLRTHGVGPGSRVGVLLDRSPELIAVLIALLRVGAAYVPMDPHSPDQRLAFVASDAGLELLVTDRTTAALTVSTRTVPPAALAAAGRDQAAAPRRHAQPSDPAYIVYTSGSTGRPKGVVVAHRSVMALVRGTQPDFGFGGADVWSWFHSIAFDFSVWEIWGCLLTGGRLVVVPEFARQAPEDFRRLLRDEAVTVLNQTPSSFTQLLDVELGSPDRLALRLVVFGGEPLDTRALLPWFNRYPDPVCRMVNMFGITETTVHVTAQTLTRRLAGTSTRSVGRAIPGWSVRVVDERHRTLPPGAVGEIAVGGAGLALHYLNRHELTEQRFIHDPVTGERWYLSGDRGRLRGDGTLEHLGRTDSQVKLRGYRIELAEIRNVLLADRRVLAAAVVLNHGGRADGLSARLEAFVVLAAGVAEPETAGIRARAAERLPPYMVPADLTALAAIPLTRNGKLDVDALPAPPRPITEPLPAPATEVPNTDGAGTGNPQSGGSDRELLIAQTWTEELGGQVTPDDHFFDVGGNSLLASRVVRVLRAKGLEPITVRDLYTHPTPRALAAHLDGADRAQ